MNRSELLRRRRCRALQFAILLGILLPLFQPSWITLGVGAAGIVVAVGLYLRECRGQEGENSMRRDTHA